MTKVCILNDTSRFHHGSGAVMDFIFRSVRTIGWQVTASYFGNSFMFEKGPPELDDAILSASDVILINGEGTIHHDSPMATFLLDTVERYRHKKICLVNTVWQEMSADNARKLRHVDLVVARDHRSYRDIANFYDGQLLLSPDFSFLNRPFHAPMRDQGILFGGFYWGQHAQESGIKGADMALRLLDRQNAVDITKESWHVVVNRLRSARLLVTGKHHDVMAACVARCPFLFCPIPTHKIEALGEYGGVDLRPIDMSLTADGYAALFERTIADRSAFNALFDGMDAAANAFDFEKTLLSIA